MHIDIWSDVACPWCYVGLTRFNRVLAGFEHAAATTVTLHSFQLDPTLPETFRGTEVEYLSRTKGMPQAQVLQMFRTVESAAASEGLVLHFDTAVVANSWRAHRLLHAAGNADPTGRLAWDVKLDLFEAHFVRGESIGDPQVLLRIAGEYGLDADQARAAVVNAPAQAPYGGGDALDAQVRADLSRAARSGIRGVPFFVFEGSYGLSGAQPAEVFEAALAQVWAQAHPAPVPATLPGLPVQDGSASGPAGGPGGSD